MKIAIAGFGSEGKASYRYWNIPGNDVVIVDERIIPEGELPEGARTITGEDSFLKLDDFDLIIRSPGVAPKKLPYGDKVWSQANEFFKECPATIIGVTGTKGKGTTSSLIASILRAAGKTVHLVGNIGVPALDELPKITPEDIVVYELSSFQLWDVKKSPQVAVVLMIEPDHLDIHEDYDEYLNAKGRITEYQATTDRVIFNAASQAATDIAQKSIGQRLPYPSERTAHVRENSFFYQDKELCSVDELQLPGIHNQENACAAITAIRPWVQDGAVIAEGLRSFDGLPHRLKLVREVGNVKYYDDSIATTPGSAIAALKAFSEPKVIILGGSDKGAQYDEVVSLAKDVNAKVIAIGQTGEVIASLCNEQAVFCNRIVGDMKEIVSKSQEIAEPGSVVILSPASASFDMFKNYADRGEQFTKAVQAL